MIINHGVKNDIYIGSFLIHWLVACAKLQVTYGTLGEFENIKRVNLSIGKCVDNPGVGWHSEGACIYSDCGPYSHHLRNGRQCYLQWTACYSCKVAGMWSFACDNDMEYTTIGEPVCIVRGEACCLNTDCGPAC